jgi:hypothetical protein
LVFAWQDAVQLADTLTQQEKSPSDSGAPRGFDVVVARGIVVEADGARCPGRLEDAHPVEGDGFAFIATFHCGERPERLTVTLPLLGALPGGHRHLLRLSAGLAATEATLSAPDNALALAVPAPSAAVPEVSPGEPWTAAFHAVPLGVRHILTGWDHLLFLLALALGAPRVRALVLPISAFTVAHSLTLALAAMSVFAAGPRLVEPLIALSIAVVAFDNLRRSNPPHRALVTFGFGLVHGFGFASALRDLALDSDRLVPTLLGFNLGVELGQLAAVAVAFPIVLALRRNDNARFLPVTNAAIGVAGVAIAILRVTSR